MKWTRIFWTTLVTCCFTVILAIVALPAVALAIDALQPEVPMDLEAVLVLARSGAWWALASGVTFLAVQLLRGKIVIQIPLISAWIESLKPLPRLIAIFALTVAAFALLAVPGGVEAIIAGAVFGVQAACGAVAAHQGWKLVRQEPVGLA